MIWPDDFINKIIQGDCLEIMKQMPNESVDCIVTSPPYNKGFYNKHTPHKTDTWKQRNIKYGEFGDDLPREKYIEQQLWLLSEMIRILKPLGSIFYNHKSVIHDHKIDFPEYVFKYNVRQIIVWDRGSSPQLAPIRWFPTSEYIFWITKTNTQPKFYRKGEFNTEVWRISAKPMLEHPAPFPEKLVSQCVIATTNENDIVFDPYMGSGTTARVAKTLKRNYIGIELNPEYIKITNQRLKQEILNL